MRSLHAATVALLLAGCATGQGVSTPQSVARAFCKATQSSSDSAAFLRLAAPELSLLIQRAEQDNAVIAARAPDEKPPLGDGLPFQAFPDYAPVCKSGTVTPTMGKTLVEVFHGFKGENAAHSWSDKLILNQDNLIEDILFAPDYTNSMRRMLQNAFNSY